MKEDNRDDEFKEKVGLCIFLLQFVGSIILICILMFAAEYAIYKFT